VRAGRWKLIRNAETDRWTLFDLLEDPEEMRDVSAAHPDVVEELKKHWKKGRGAFRLKEDAESPAPNDLIREQLRALGYLE
jgi:hypothetical protein